MNKKYLLSSVTAGIALLYANQGMAQDCVQSQDCASLGYTETSCTSGGVKCPFGDKWACYPEPDNSVVCEVGTLYYSDGSCYNEKVDDKTLLGVVIYADGAGGGWIMTIKPVATGIAWDTGSYYSTGITDKAVSASCTNTQKLVNLGSRFAAANKANSYKPSGTPSGKTWCLPSYDLLNNINNSTNFAKINAGITIAGGRKIGFSTSYNYEYVWSSSEYGNGLAWTFSASTGGSFNMNYSHKFDCYGYNSVRPVLAF